MYVPPRPRRADDPGFAIRLGLVAVVGFVAMAVLRPALSPICVALPIGLIAGLRQAFNPGRAIGGGIAFALVVWLSAGLIALTRPVPGIMLLVVFALYFLAFYVTRRTGSPFGMLILVSVSLMSIAGMKHPSVLNVFRDGFIEGCVVAIIMIPTLYLIVRPVTRQVHVDNLRPAGGHHAAGALIRAVVLMALSFWLYAILPVSDLILAVAAIFPLVFPTRDEAFAEAWERSTATVLGGSAAMVVLAIFSFSAHFSLLLVLIFTLAWSFGEAMMEGRRSASVYQFALSVAAVLVATSLTSGNPFVALAGRIALTMVGSLAAALLVAVLDQLFLAPRSDEDNFSPHPAVQRKRFGREAQV